MKTSLKYILLVLFSSVFLASCVDEEKIRFELDDAEKVVNMRFQFDPEYSFLDFGDINNAKLIYSVYSENTNIDRVEISLRYYSVAADSLGEKQVWTTFEQSDFGNNGIIADVTETSQDIASFLGISVDDFSGGDRLDITQVTYLTNGLVYPDTVLQDTEFENVNISTTITGSTTTTSFTTALSAYIACPTDPSLWVGDYNTAVSNVDNFCGLLDCSSTRPATISFVGSPEPFRYSTTSHDGGLWGSYSAGSYDRTGNFYDICETPLLLPSSTGFGDHQDNPAMPNPPRDPDTGVIVMNWCNFFNPVCGTTTYTPI